VVFVDCLKELPATLLLRPLNVEALATSIYRYASRGGFEEGALAALLIAAASIPAVMWLTRLPMCRRAGVVAQRSPDEVGAPRSGGRCNPGKASMVDGPAPDCHPGYGATPSSFRCLENICHAAMNIAAITGPMTKPFSPNASMPPSVEISTT